MKKVLMTILAITLAFTLCASYASAAYTDNWDLYHAFYDGNGVLTEDLDDPETNGFTVSDAGGKITVTYPTGKWWPSALAVLKAPVTINGFTATATLSMTDAGWGAVASITLLSQAPTGLPVGGAPGLYCSDGIQAPDGALGIEIQFRGASESTDYTNIALRSHGFEWDVDEALFNEIGCLATNASQSSNDPITVLIEEDATLGFVIKLNGTVLKDKNGGDIDLTAYKNALGTATAAYASISNFAPGSATGGMVITSVNGTNATEYAGTAAAADTIPTGSQTPTGDSVVVIASVMLISLVAMAFVIKARKLA